MAVVVIAAAGAGGAAQPIHRDVNTLSFQATGDFGNPYRAVEFKVTFTRPDGSTATVDGFYDGNKTFKARAYCDTLGTWSWTSSSNDPGLHDKSGTFHVAASSLPGKLRKHADDPRQFAYDNGQWFLHIGDTGYRYVTATEPKWKEYIDQAARAGFTKIRTWFCQGRSDVQVLFNEDRTGLNLPYWQEIDRRIQYALKKHPNVILKLIPYGEDTQELRRYGKGDKASMLIAQYAQARFSAYPNIYWCISNDREIVEKGPLKGRQVLRETISTIGRDMAAREPWGTLITNHQSRFKGYDFVDEPWSDVITLEDLDQVDGKVLLEYRKKGNDPVINDEDRYEHWRNPKHDRYYFRRLMWASLLSGGHATYGGLKTYEPYDGDLRGVQGYSDAVAAGKLEHGADDFVHIHKFFKDTGLRLAGMTPDDAGAGNTPLEYKCIRNDTTCIVYLANPDNPKPELANADADAPSVTMEIRAGAAVARTVVWFNPRTGEWTEPRSIGADRRTFTAPGPGDWVLLIRAVIRPQIWGAQTCCETPIQSRYISAVSP